jgi:hypothetical protein
VKRATTRTAAFVLALSFAFAGVGSPFMKWASAQEDDEEFFDLGITEYELSCMPCHGMDGRGDGPDARFLSTKPADLSRITKMNGDIFPAEGLAIFIDGRAMVAAHGPREMPVWGDRYRLPNQEPGEDWDTEHEARSRIKALVGYIESLQQP